MTLDEAHRIARALDGGGDIAVAREIVRLLNAEFHDFRWRVRGWPEMKELFKSDPEAAEVVVEQVVP